MENWFTDHRLLLVLGVQMGDPSTIFTGFFSTIGAEGEGLTTAGLRGDTQAATEMCPGGPSHLWSGLRSPSQVQQVFHIGPFQQEALIVLK